ncbi:hypothetical protein JYT19_01215 [Sulfobacillus acidophilus]|uniref:Chromosome partitioning protein ParB n=1 Tax=Sulfobacillus acidophilus TaxID=53633 RepID=A0ABS3AZG7_9FIRM|nr:hypothetical protein [Sulfobacillus acidophilus]
MAKKNSKNLKKDLNERELARVSGGVIEDIRPSQSEMPKDMAPEVTVGQRVAQFQKPADEFKSPELKSAKLLYSAEAPPEDFSADLDLIENLSNQGTAPEGISKSVVEGAKDYGPQFWYHLSAAP